MDRSCQTVGLRKVHIINPVLCKIAAYVSVNFPVLQVRSLVWGQFAQHHAIEISRIKADIPPQRGGPATVTVVRVTDAEQADLIVAGDVIESVSGLLNEGTCNFVDSEKIGKLLERLGPAHVFCAGVSKTEFQAVFSGVRYVPDSVVEKNVPFNRVASKKCLKWYTLRTNATRDERNIVLEGDNRCAECNQMYRRARSTSKRNLDFPLK